MIYAVLSKARESASKTTTQRRRNMPPTTALSFVPASSDCYVPLHRRHYEQSQLLR